MSRWWKIFLFAGVNLTVAASVLADESGSGSCPPDTLQELSLAGTDWIVVTTVWSCGALDPGRMEITAKNSHTTQIVELAKFDEAVPVELSSSSSRQVTITLPNFVDMTESKTEFDDVSVSYNFLPRNDPEQRANYQFWLHHPNDPKAVEWFHHEIEPKLDPRLRDPQ